MRNKIFLHLLYLAVFFLLISLIRNWLELKYINFWVGGVIGAFLPDLDRIIYVYILRPNEASAKKAAWLLTQGAAKESVDMMVKMEDEDKELIFHNARFQLIFLLFAVLIVTSTGSLLGRGIVLGALLHLLIDQLKLYMEKRNIDGWFKNLQEILPWELDAQKKRFYLILNGLALLILGFLL